VKSVTLRPVPDRHCVAVDGVELSGQTLFVAVYTPRGEGVGDLIVRHFWASDLAAGQEQALSARGPDEDFFGVARVTIGGPSLPRDSWELDARR